MRRLVLCLFLVLFSGCNVVPWATRNTWLKAKQYSVSDSSAATQTGAKLKRGILVGLGILITPFALAFDVVFLPFEAIGWAIYNMEI